MLISGTIVDEAKNVARSAHHTQTRKDGVTPHFDHLQTVFSLLQAAGVTDENILAAAYLHDVLEDTEYGIDNLRLQFNDTVVGYVVELTVPDGVGKQEKRAWQETHCATMSDGAKIIKIADQVANVACTFNEMPGWTAAECSAYIDKAEAVCNVCAGVSPILDNAAEVTIATSRALLEDEHIKASFDDGKGEQCVNFCLPVLYHRMFIEREKEMGMVPLTI